MRLLVNGSEAARAESLDRGTLAIQTGKEYGRVRPMCEEWGKNYTRVSSAEALAGTRAAHRG
jgi:hypothetical protein